MDFAKIKVVLKQEFIGIDYVIDRIVDSARTWYLFDKQRRPTIINLWGMTGSGKTKLINRLIELLDKNDKFSQINLADHQKISEDFSNMLTESSMTQKESRRMIFLLDDFHVCKTIGNDKVDSSLGVIWDLLDSGIVTLPHNLIDVWEEFSIKEDFASIYRLGLRDCKVGDSPNKIKVFNCAWLSNDDQGDDDGKLMIKSILSLENFINLNGKTNFFEIGNDVHDIVDFLKNTTFRKLEEFYTHAIKNSKSFSSKFDFSQSLIFVTGNIDELYRAHDMDDDESPDNFHRDSKDIKFNDLKKVLSDYYFRPEHISRLGSNHIIYRAFSTKNYKDIISHYLKQMNNDYKTNITFDKSVVDIIFSECVIASQGVRPVLSAINYIVESHMPDIITKYKKKKLNIKYSRKKLIINNTDFFPVNLINRCYTYDKKSPEFARTVVHEAGHAFMHYMFMKEAPEFLVIKNNSSSYGGYVIGTSDDENTKETILNRVGYYLGGKVAETIIFGSSGDGCSQDLEMASSVIENMLMKYGMGTQYGISKYKDTTYEHVITDVTNEREKYLKNITEKCENYFTDNIDEFKRLIRLVHKKCKLTNNDFKKFWNIKEDKKSKSLEIYNEIIG